MKSDDQISESGGHGKVEVATLNCLAPSPGTLIPLGNRAPEGKEVVREDSLGFSLVPSLRWGLLEEVQFCGGRWDTVRQKGHRNRKRRQSGGLEYEVWLLLHLPGWP